MSQPRDVLSPARMADERTPCGPIVRAARIADERALCGPGAAGTADEPARVGLSRRDCR